MRPLNNFKTCIWNDRLSWLLLIYPMKSKVKEKMTNGGISPQTRSFSADQLEIVEEMLNHMQAKCIEFPLNWQKRLNSKKERICPGAFVIYCPETKSNKMQTKQKLNFSVLWKVIAMAQPYNRLFCDLSGVGGCTGTHQFHAAHIKLKT